MTANILNSIQSFGSPGLLLSMFLEGSSLPFPGIVVVLTLGYLLNPDVEEIIWMALGMSLAYSIASYIPYAIGLRLENSMEHALAAKLTKVQYWFRRYGEFSICLTRPFGVGNYISYVAGMSKVRPWRYGLLTFAGIFPWSLAMLFLARIYHGNTAAIYKLFDDFGIYLLAALAVLSLCWRIFLVFYKKTKGDAGKGQERG